MASQTIVGPDTLQYTQDNLRCYAFSGKVACDDTQTILLNFLTGSGVIIARLDFGTGSVSNRDMMWQVFLDDIEVYSYVSSGTNQAGANPQNTIDIILPPFTQVKVTSENQSDDNSENQYCILTGRVYEGLPVRN